MSEKVRPSIISKDAYDRIMATLRAHRVQSGQINYCFEEVFVYDTEAAYTEASDTEEVSE